MRIAIQCVSQHVEIAPIKPQRLRLKRSVRASPKGCCVRRSCRNPQSCMSRRDEKSAALHALEQMDPETLKRILNDVRHIASICC